MLVHLVEFYCAFLVLEKILSFWQFVCRRILRYIVSRFPIARLNPNLVYSFLATLSGVVFRGFSIFEFYCVFLDFEKRLSFWQFVCRRILRYIISRLPIAWLSPIIVYSFFETLSGSFFHGFSIFKFYCIFLVFENILSFWQSLCLRILGTSYIGSQLPDLAQNRFLASL